MMTRKTANALAHADTVTGALPHTATVQTAVVRPQVYVSPVCEVTRVNHAPSMMGRKCTSFVLSAEQLLSMEDSGEFERADAPHPACVIDDVIGWSEDGRYFLSLVTDEVSL